MISDSDNFEILLKDGKVMAFLLPTFHHLHAILMQLEKGYYPGYFYFPCLPPTRVSHSSRDCLHDV